MSYDVWLTIDTGGPEAATVSDYLSQTSNVAPMWRLAGADLAEFAGKLAEDVAPLLEAAIIDMEAKPAKYQVLNPTNGWGSYDTCLEFLRKLLADFRANPRATVHVDH